MGKEITGSTTVDMTHEQFRSRPALVHITRALAFISCLGLLIPCGYRSYIKLQGGTLPSALTWLEGPKGHIATLTTLFLGTLALSVDCIDRKCCVDKKGQTPQKQEKSPVEEQQTTSTNNLPATETRDELDYHKLNHAFVFFADSFNKRGDPRGEEEILTSDTGTIRAVLLRLSEKPLKQDHLDLLRTLSLEGLLKDAELAFSHFTSEQPLSFADLQAYCLTLTECKIALTQDAFEGSLFTVVVLQNVVGMGLTEILSIPVREDATLIYVDPTNKDTAFAEKLLSDGQYENCLIDTPGAKEEMEKGALNNSDFESFALTKETVNEQLANQYELTVDQLRERLNNGTLTRAHV